MLEFGTPAPVGHVRRKVASGDSERGSECTPSPTDDTPTMLRRSLTPPSPPPAFGLFASGPKSRACNAYVVMLSFATLITVGTTMGFATYRPQSPPPIRRELSEDLSLLLNRLEALQSRQQDDLQSMRKEVAAQITELRSHIDRMHQKSFATSTVHRVEPSTLAARSPMRAHAPPPVKSAFVHVWFIFDATEQLSKTVELYWLLDNSTERHYATIPAGQRVEETTTPGQCWRARTPSSALFRGQHLLTYCATSEPRQFVNVVPQREVSVYFDFPRSRSAPSVANLYQVRAIGSQPAVEQLVNKMEQGQHVELKVAAGSRFVARSPASRKVLLNITVGHETEQHFDISGTNVTLELTLAPSTPTGEGVSLYWTWEGHSDSNPTIGREHLHAELTETDKVLRVQSAPGEEWIVRRKSETAEKLRTIVLTDDPVQRHVVVLPPLARRRH